MLALVIDDGLPGATVLPVVVVAHQMDGGKDVDENIEAAQALPLEIRRQADFSFGLVLSPDSFPALADHGEGDFAVVFDLLPVEVHSRGDLGRPARGRIRRRGKPPGCQGGDEDGKSRHCRRRRPRHSLQWDSPSPWP